MIPPHRQERLARWVSLWLCVLGLAGLHMINGWPPHTPLLIGLAMATAGMCLVLLWFVIMTTWDLFQWGWPVLVVAMDTAWCWTCDHLEGCRRAVIQWCRWYWHDLWKE